MKRILLIGALFPVAFQPVILQAEFLESITDTICPQQWLCAGPFSVGGREGLTGVIDSIQGFEPEEGVELPSVLVQGGKVKWKYVGLDSTGKVNIDYEDVWWDTLQDYFGYAGVGNLSYAWCNFNNEGKKRGLVISKKSGSFVLNGRRYPGGSYHGRRNYIETPVILEDGENHLLVPIRGKFSFKIVPAQNTVIAFNDYTLPDAIIGKKLMAWAGMTLLNTTNKRLDNVVVTIGGDEHIKAYKKTINNVPPLCAKKIAVKVQTDGIDSSGIVWLPVKMEYLQYVYNDSVKLRVREEGESFAVTFLSDIDRSVQYFGVLPPADFDESKTYALIMSTHGAGCEGRSQVDRYTQKDWAFVIAPTNRRPLGFDWEDWGRLDALEVLDEAISRFPIDTNRIHLTGHSMGGHGAWHIGISHPDLFAALAPSAGWTHHSFYVPWIMQKSELFSEPSQLAFRDMVIREDKPLLFLENALNLPIFIMQGGSDNDVPPIQARFFAKYLTDLKYDFRYMEVPGKGHWWDDDEIEGKAAVNHPELIGFLKEHVRDRYPEHVIFRTPNISLNNKNYWVKIDEQELLYHDSRIEARVCGDTIKVCTQNISAFTLELNPELLPFGKLVLEIDGKPIRFSFDKPCEVNFHEKKGVFRIGKSKRKGLCKTLNQYGPLKQAYFTPFVLVYGTRGDSASNEISFNNAWFESWTWWRRSNGICEVLPDTEVTDAIVQEYNLILFGGPEVNSVTRKVNPSLPIQIREGRVFMGKTKLRGEDLAVEEIYPNPLNQEKLIVLFAGTSAKAERLCCFFPTLYSAAGVPDFMVYDIGVRKKAWAETRVVGFFDHKWQLDEKLYYSRHIK